jgi:anti-anti-sigma factor
MNVAKTRQGDVQVVRLSGKLDGSTSPKAQQQIMADLDLSGAVVIDMSECSFVSSAGLRVLLNLAKALAGRGGKGALAHLMDEVADAMRITGFGNVFPPFPDVDAAIAALRQQTP